MRRIKVKMFLVLRATARISDISVGAISLETIVNVKEKGIKKNEIITARWLVTGWWRWSRETAKRLP